MISSWNIDLLTLPVPLMAHYYYLLFYWPECKQICCKRTVNIQSRPCIGAELAIQRFQFTTHVPTLPIKYLFTRQSPPRAVYYMEKKTLVQVKWQYCSFCKKLYKTGNSLTICSYYTVSNICKCYRTLPCLAPTNHQNCKWMRKHCSSTMHKEGVEKGQKMPKNCFYCSPRWGVYLASTAVQIIASS